MAFSWGSAQEKYLSRSTTCSKKGIERWWRWVWRHFCQVHFTFWVPILCAPWAPWRGGRPAAGLALGPQRSHVPLLKLKSAEINLIKIHLCAGTSPVSKSCTATWSERLLQQSARTAHGAEHGHPHGESRTAQHRLRGEQQCETRWRASTWRKGRLEKPWAETDVSLRTWGWSLHARHSFLGLVRSAEAACTDRASIPSGGAAPQLTSSSKGDQSQASTEWWNIFFSSKLNKYRVWWVLRPTSTEVWLYSEWKTLRI